VVGAATKGLVSGAVDGGGVVLVGVEEVELEEVVDEAFWPTPVLALGPFAARPACLCLPFAGCLTGYFSFLPA
jgi:hypothetical protein